MSVAITELERSGLLVKESYFPLSSWQGNVQPVPAQPVLSRLRLPVLTMSVKTGARLGIPRVPGLRSGFLV